MGIFERIPVEQHQIGVFSKYDWGAETQTNVQLRAARTWWGKSLMAAQRLRRSLRS